MKNITGIVAAIIIGMPSYGGAAPADREPGGPNTVYEVPTPGRIRDVEYRPEFDQWWVKCEEGKAVVVYSYDVGSKKWSKVQFVPTAAAIKESGAAKQSGEKTAETPEKAPDLAPDRKAKPTGKEDERKPEKDTKKWYDIGDVIKSGKKLFQPSESGTDKKDL